MPTPELIKKLRRVTKELNQYCYIFGCPKKDLQQRVKKYVAGDKKVRTLVAKRVNGMILGGIK